MKKEKSEREQRKEMSEGERIKTIIDKYGPDKIMYKRNIWKENLEIYVFVEYLGIRIKQSFD